jgi:hypothetical protein
VEDQGDSLSALEAALAQLARRGILQRRELGVRDRGPRKEDCRRVSATGRTRRVDESASEVERG